MKTSDQIARQLRFCKFEESEWVKVREYCMLALRFRPVKPFHGRIDYTYELFMDWLNNGYGAGDIIRYGRCVSIVSYHIQNELSFCAYFGIHDELIDRTESLYEARHNNISSLSDEDKDKYERILAKAGMYVDEKFGILTRKPLAKVGCVYMFKHNGEICCGKVKSRTVDGVTMYYRYTSNNLSEEDVTVSREDIVRELSDTEEEDMHNHIMNKYGCQWSDLDKTFLFRPQRVAKGKAYYYFTDKFTITSGYDNRNRLNDMRYTTGNYFISREDAMQFLIAIQKLRSEQIKTGLSVTDHPV